MLHAMLVPCKSLLAGCLKMTTMMKVKKETLNKLKVLDKIKIESFYHQVMKNCSPLFSLEFV
jgi:hypothetical protein